MIGDNENGKLNDRDRERIIDTYLNMSEEQWQWHLDLVNRHGLMRGPMKEDIEAIQMLRDFREDSL